MQNLREIGSRYNGLQDALDAQKAALRGARDPQERRALRRSAAETRRELKRLKASLSGEALQAYRDYRAIRRAMTGWRARYSARSTRPIFTSCPPPFTPCSLR